MQRLYSMFPTGMAGMALALLRVSLAATLMVDGSAHGMLLTSFWRVAVFALPATLLCLGLLTPYGSILCCVLEVAMLVLEGGTHGFDLASAAVVSATVAVLGPGAYSIDARLFGRRLLTLPPRG